MMKVGKVSWNTYSEKVKKSATAIRPATISLPPTSRMTPMARAGSMDTTAGMAALVCTRPSCRRYSS
jgi:hypothetical protein